MSYELVSLLLFGGLVGVTHALEADHLAAVAAMNTRRGTARQVVLRGAMWGVGHSLSLLAICGTAIVLGLVITATTEAALEFCVGTMIVGLGAHVLWTLRARRIHFHVHEHGETRHVHAHSHAGETVPHDRSAHAHVHPHPAASTWKALAIGLVHGAAGSGGLLVLVVAATQSVVGALFYVLVFGIGSILGMAALSLIAAWPLGVLQRSAGRLDMAVTVAIGFLALFVGGGLMTESAAVFWS